MSPARFRWGIILILIGVLILLNNFGRMSWWEWEDILSLWPLLLITIGLEKIFTHTKLKAISYITSVALAVVVLWVAFSGVEVRGFDRNSSSYAIKSDNDVSQINSRIELKNSDVNISGTMANLFEADYRGSDREPEINYDLTDGRANIDFTERKRWDFVRIGERNDHRFDLEYDRHLPVDLFVTGQDANIKVDGRRMNLDNLEVYSESGRVRVYVSDEEKTNHIKLTGESRAEFRLYIPEGAALKISGGSGGLEDVFARQNCVEKDGYFVSEGYDTVASKVDIQLSHNVSDLRISRY